MSGWSNLPTSRWTLGLISIASGLFVGSTVAAGAAHRAGSFPTRHFHSEPWLHPYSVSVSRDRDTRSGDIFLTPRAGTPGPGGLMILNARGQLVWFHSLAPGWGADLEVQSYRGQPVLTWWQGLRNAHGRDVIANRSYQTVAVVRAGNGFQTDSHDFVITPLGTAWVMATRNRAANLTSVGGPSRGTVNDAAIQEVDIASGRVLWQWDAYRHIPLDASYARPSNGWFDAYHLNSIQLLRGGKLLVSSRNTWSVYEIDIRTKKILWTLGGKRDNFRIGPRARFEWQHTAHLVGQTLTLFDDGAGNGQQEEPQSSAKVLRLNLRQRTARLVHAYTHSPPLLATVQGNAQTLPNGNLFVGWGSEPDFSEYTPGGRQILTGSFPLGLSSYRALRFPWYGQPLTHPAVAVAPRAHGRAIVWASWNGATNVAAWRLLGGSSANSLHTLATKPRHSFETAIILGKRPRYIRVQALDGHGGLLGASSLRSSNGSR